MTWIIPDHSKFSAYAQDMAASSLDLSEQGCVLAQSLMWRSKPSPSATWLRRLKKESWLQHLSTRILKPSRTERFVERWTASLEDIPASRSQPQESDSEKKIQDISGPTLQTAFAFADPDGASLKTSKDTLPAGCVTSCQTWQEWVTEQRGDYSQRVKLAHRTNASGSISWPTITANEDKDQGSSWECLAKLDKGGRILRRIASLSLNGHPDQANPSTNGNRQGFAETDEQSCENWPSPRAGNPGSRPNGKGGKILAEEARKHTNWPTPDTQNHRDGSVLRKDNNIKKGGSHGVSLHHKVAHEQKQQWATPRANKVHPYITEKNRSHLANRNKSNLEEDVAGYIGSVTGKLNPRWVETLMGLPIGWVSPEPVTHTTCTNRTDELRMLGNGVVPQTAAKAFTILAERLS